jgi:hypothetical protein
MIWNHVEIIYLPCKWVWANADRSVIPDSGKFYKNRTNVWETLIVLDNYLSGSRRTIGVNVKSIDSRWNGKGGGICICSEWKIAKIMLTKFFANIISNAWAVSAIYNGNNNSYYAFIWHTMSYSKLALHCYSAFQSRNIWWENHRR